MKKLYLLYNPKSGRETFKNSLGDIVEKLTAAGYEVTVRPTSCSKEATEIAEKLSGDYELLVCCGGDGTLNETLAGNLKREKALTLGYLPCGSTNDFGNTVYGPGNDVMQVLSRIISGSPREMDCGSLAGQPFVYTAGFGIFTDVSYETTHEAKATLGHAAYLFEAAKSLGSIKTFRVRAVINEEEVIEGSFLIGLVTNADYVGGIQNIPGKDVSLHDGELELTMIASPEKPGDFSKAIQALFEGSQNESVLRRKVRSVHFEFEEETPFTMDGEYGGTYREVDASCLPAAFNLVY